MQGRISMRALVERKALGSAHGDDHGGGVARDGDYPSSPAIALASDVERPAASAEMGSPRAVILREHGRNVSGRGRRNGGWWTGTVAEGLAR